MNRNLRILVAVCLVATALLSAAWSLMSPEFSADAEETLTAIADGGTAAGLSAFGFAIAQLPFLVGIAGVAAWLHRTSPRLAVVGGTLAVLGGFGHAVFGGAAMTQVLMADDPAAYASLAEDIQSFPLLIPFMAAGLLGTVFGLILLGVAHFRSKQEPRWVGPALWAFVLVEFVGTNFSDWATYLAALLYVAAFVGLAVRIVADRQATSLAPAQMS